MLRLYSYASSSAGRLASPSRTLVISLSFSQSIFQQIQVELMPVKVSAIVRPSQRPARRRGTET